MTSPAVHWYFAYGSNMNPARVEGRGMRFRRAIAGSLEGFDLHFNKRSSIHAGMAAANVVRAPDGLVEGVLYELSTPDQIKQMDPFEGYPEKYVREVCMLKTGEGLIGAWVYIATDKWLAEGLRPARWYLEHLLAGKGYLSQCYFESLRQVVCLPDSEIEPA